MAASSIFGDSSLFDEFEREREPSDKILQQKLLTDERKKRLKTLDDGSDSAFSAEFHVGTSSESCESEDEFTKEHRNNRDNGLSGVTDVLHSLKEVKRYNQIGTDRSVHKMSKDDVVEDSLYFEMKSKAVESKAVNELMEENQKLKRQMHLVSCDLNMESDEGPAFQVLFMNHQVSRKYKTEIEDFMYHLLQNDERNENVKEIQLRPNSVHLSEKVERSVSSSGKLQLAQEAVVIGCGKFYREFIVDSMGWPLVQYKPELTDGWQTPLYDQFYNQSLPFEDDCDGNDRPLKPQRVKATCFNCGGDHNLKDCMEKRDFRKINKARKEFMDTNSPINSSLKKQRYIIEETSSVENRFKPGEISINLRDALGINSQQLPPYIYQMRSLGYPPGWLLEAEIMYSGVAIFDKFGKEVSEDGKGAEDGEIDVAQQQKKKYNKNQVVSYPGFNVDLPEGTIDEYKKLNMLPMQQCHQKEELELFMTPLNASNSKKRPSSDVYSRQEKKLRTDDMELVASENDDPIPNRQIFSDSPRVTALDRTGLEKDNLEVCDMNNEDGEIADDSFIPPVPPTPDRPPLPPGTPPVTCEFKTPLPPTHLSGMVSLPNQITPTQICLSDGNESNSEVIDTDSNTSYNSQQISTTPDIINGHLLQSPNSSSGSLSLTFGTPVLEQLSSNTCNGKGLPQASKFAAGITEHIPFENLPQATGKYGQMKKVLEWVRSKNDK